MREEREREVMRTLLALSLASALAVGPAQRRSRVTSLPTKMPRCVPVLERGRAGQGLARRAAWIAGQHLVPAVGTATDLSLLTPRPETSENSLIKTRAIGKKREVISKSEGANVRKARDVNEERVVSNNEEEGGEGATLFDTSFNINPLSELSAKKGGNLDRGERTFDEVTKPNGETGFDQDMRNPVMINGVEGFGSIQKEKKLVLFLLNSPVKKVINFSNMLGPLPPSYKALLRGVNVSINSGHNAPRHASRQNPVIRVSDAKGAGVRNEARKLFGKKEEETVVKIFGGGLAFEERNQNIPKNSSSEIGSSAPGSKGNAIWPRRGVVRELYGPGNFFEGGESGKGGDHRLSYSLRKLERRRESGEGTGESEKRSTPPPPPPPLT
jgi:hypothetical protein